VAAGASEIAHKVLNEMPRVTLKHCTTHTCRTLLDDLFEYLLCTFEKSLLADRLTATEHSLVVRRVLRQCLLRRFLRASPIFALDVACGHVRIDLLDEVIRLQGCVARG
jgi:hypothetical protein